MKVDHYGERLVGCLECNRWGKPGDENLIMELMEGDLEALQEVVTHSRQARSVRH